LFIVSLIEPPELWFEPLIELPALWPAPRFEVRLLALEAPLPVERTTSFSDCGQLPLIGLLLRCATRFDDLG